MRPVRLLSLLLPFPVAGLLALAGASSSCSSASPAGAGGGAPAGAMVAVSLQSQVAVLLEDLPAALRDQAAAEAIARPAAFWSDRARRQAAFTHFRLFFRRQYYLYYAGTTKGQLPMPPEDRWTIALDPAGPRRAMVDGHDVVTVGYTLTSTLLSDADSPRATEPSLGKVGGHWDEPFVLPLDPELVFQRTGYACMRETESPPHSVDGENAHTFYDQSCLAVAPGLLNCHVSNPSWPVDCDAALKTSVGRVSANLHFERVAWDAATADAARVGTVTTPDAPDLAVVPAGLESHRIIYRYVPQDSCALSEQCVGGPGWRRLLQFDASVNNVGGKPLHIGTVMGSELLKHNVYYFSPCHQHFHFRFYGSFELGNGSDQTGSKRAFCLVSLTRYANNESTALSVPYDDCSFQGIAAGWGDDYIAGLDCQWIDITKVDTSKAAVTRPLTFVSNNDRFLCEGAPKLDASGAQEFAPTTFKTEMGAPIDRPLCDFSPGWDGNNTGSAQVTVPEEGGLVTGPCTRGQTGPRRDCGFTRQPQALACTPGKKITVSCTIADATSPQLLRLCETSKVLGTGVACAYRDAVGTGTVQGAPLEVQATCPAARDATEPGGEIAVYGSPAFDAGKAQPVTCTVR